MPEAAGRGEGETCADGKVKSGRKRRNVPNPRMTAQTLQTPHDAAAE
jgi:hypothetical protein